MKILIVTFVGAYNINPCSRGQISRNDTIIFDREYVVRRGLRSDFVVVGVLDHQEHLYEICLKVFPVISGHFWTCVLKCEKVLKLGNVFK